MPKIKICPAILSPNKQTVQKDVSEVEKYTDLLQVDIMDNIFVPNLTPQAEQLTWFTTSLPLDMHLMVKEPTEEYFLGFINANPKLKIHDFTVHYEACSNIEKTIAIIKKLKVKVGIAINPKTGVEKIKKYLDRIDMVLVMTVEPGFSGQLFIEEALSKVTELRKLRPNLDIQVDGGITDKTGHKAALAGANMFVANSYIWKAPDRKKAVDDLKKAVQ